jgi:biotin carboxyl carrier protein
VANVVTGPTVTRTGDGTYRVETHGRAETVYVAGPAHDRWAFWNGRVFRVTSAAGQAAPVTRRAVESRESLAAPMPATVLKVLVAPGASVKKGDTLVILEAMKMELPLRASGAAVVKAVHCREGDLVQPDTTLVELE